LAQAFSVMSKEDFLHKTGHGGRGRQFIGIDAETAFAFPDNRLRQHFSASQKEPSFA
jgi:hypothetical protein